MSKITSTRVGQTKNGPRFYQSRKKNLEINRFLSDRFFFQLLV